MGFMDNAKDKLSKAVDSHSEQIDSGIDKAGEFADSKTGGKHSEHIDSASDKLREGLDGLDGKDDDFKNATGQNAN